MSKQDILNDFDSEPVVFCPRCYSLNIIYEEAVGEDCCGECGCSDVQTSSIEEWEKLYEKRYGQKFVKESSNIRKHPIFLLNTGKLKTLVYNNPSWREICFKLYPSFPNGLSKADSIVLLFAKLCENNRMNDLREELINRDKKI